MAGISIINSDPNAAPVREGRLKTGSISAINGEVVLPINGDQSALVQVIGTSPVLTVVFEVSIDGVNYYPTSAVPTFGSGGTVPSYAQPLALELYAATVAIRVYQVRCGAFRYVRVRASTYTSGNIDVTISADANDTYARNLDSVTPATLVGTATGAAGASVTLTLPAVTGLRHYITGYEINRLCTTAVATANAVPTLVTTTNLGVVVSMPNPVEAVGSMLTFSRAFGDAGLAATAAGTATTFPCPLSANHMYRVTAFYRLGV